MELSGVWFLLCALVASAPILASPLSDNDKAYTAGAVSNLFQFDFDGYWIENIAVRENNNLLVTTALPYADVWEVSSSGKGNWSASRLVRFPNVTSTTGITEVQPDLFAVIAVSLDLPSVVYNSTAIGSYPGSASIWTIDYRDAKSARRGQFQTPRIQQAVRISTGRLLNGLTTLSSEGGTLLAADSERGLVYRINIFTGEFEIVLQDNATMAIGVSGLPLGVNGVRVVDNYLYYTNTNRGLFCRVALNPDGTAAGPYEVISSGPFGDDLAVLPGGHAFVAGLNTIVQVLPDGASSYLVGGVDETVVQGVTSVQLGRGWKKNTLFAVTSGGQNYPINGTIYEPGKVVAVELVGSSW